MVIEYIVISLIVGLPLAFLIYMIGWIKGCDYNDDPYNWSSGFDSGWISGWDCGFDAGFMRAMPKWIKYSEQKPEKDGKYVVAEVYKDRVGYDLGDFFSEFPVDLMRSGEWFGPNFYVYWDEEDEWTPVSTYGTSEIYWMPIPELPKKEGE